MNMSTNDEIAAKEAAIADQIAAALLGIRSNPASAMDITPCGIPAGEVFRTRVFYHFRDGQSMGELVCFRSKPTPDLDGRGQVVLGVRMLDRGRPDGDRPGAPGATPR